MDTSFRDDFIAECIVDTDNSFELILHCIHEMEGEMIWWQPDESSLSAGYLVNHIVESMQQWVTTIKGGTSDNQKTIGSWSERNMPKNEMICELIKIKNEIIAAIKQLTELQLLEIHEVNARPVTLLGVIFRFLSHISYHAGQIAYVAKLQLKENYRPFWITATKNEESSGGSSI